jgi:hypothetical protein
MLPGNKKAKDAAYELASQLLAAQLNIEAGARTCSSLTEAIQSAQELLFSIGFDGTGGYLGPRSRGIAAQIRQEALNLSTSLDSYNNNEGIEGDCLP